MKSLAGLLFLVYCGSSSACYSPPAQQLVTPLTQLETSRSVFLAKVHKAELLQNGAVVYDLNVEKAYVGVQANQSVRIMGSIGIGESRDETFRHHHDDAFWTPLGGRTVNDISCEISPSFTVGATYLVFLDSPYTRKSFERIIRISGEDGFKDKWLSYVEKYFKRN